mmetsp:Transcript_33/g.44  ORF Transcript_33/g.44 Transcript_33/m.44 type:complete len:805 (-) Transcript_33:244-2658(-)
MSHSFQRMIVIAIILLTSPVIKNVSASTSSSSSFFPFFQKEKDQSTSKEEEEGSILNLSVPMSISYNWPPSPHYQSQQQQQRNKNDKYYLSDDMLDEDVDDLNHDYHSSSSSSSTVSYYGMERYGMGREYDILDIFKKPKVMTTATHHAGKTSASRAAAAAAAGSKSAVIATSSTGGGGFSFAATGTSKSSSFFKTGGDDEKSKDNFSTTKFGSTSSAFGSGGGFVSNPGSSSGQSSTGFGFGAVSSKGASSPFGAFGAGSKGFTGASAASGGFPSIPSKALTPFGGAVTVSKYSAPVTSSAASDVIPPISSKVPSPFGVAAASSIKSAIPSKSSSAIDGYPLISSNDPTPLGGRNSAKSPGANDVFQKYIAASDLEVELWRLVGDFDSSLSSLREQRKDQNLFLPSENAEPKRVASKFELQVENLVDTYEKVRADAASLDEEVNEERERSTFLLSQRDDIERQLSESKKLIDEQTRSRNSGSLRASILDEQPLDSESEKQRRRITAKAVRTQKLLGCLRERIRLNDSVFETKEGYLEPSMFDQSYSRKSGEKEANAALYDTLKMGYNRTVRLGTNTDKLYKKVKEMHLSDISKIRSESRGIGRYDEQGRLDSKSEHTVFARRGPLKKLGPRIAPLPTHFTSPVGSKPSSITSQINLEAKPIQQNHIELSVRKIAEETKNVSIKTFTRRSTIECKTTSKKRTPDWRSRGTNHLMNTSETAVRASPKMISNTASSSGTVRSLFSSILSPTIPRKGWDTISNVDQEKLDALSFSLPKDVKEVHAKSAARDALGKCSNYLIYSDDLY